MKKIIVFLTLILIVNSNYTYAIDINQNTNADNIIQEITKIKDFNIWKDGEINLDSIIYNKQGRPILIYIL